MTRHSSVSINNDFTSCQTAVSMRSSDHKTSCRINEKLCFIICHICRNHFIEYIFLNIFMNPLLRHFRIVLCRKHNRIQTLWNAVFIIFHSYLCFPVRAKIRQCSVLSYFCQTARKLMRHRRRIRHIFFCFIRRITEHHSLISCSDGFNIVF